MIRSNELGIPIWLSTSRLAPPTDILRTKQSIPEPSNEIVPALMTFWRRVSRLSFITTALCQAFQFLLYTEAMIAARATAHLKTPAWNLSQLRAGRALATFGSQLAGSLMKWVYRNELANNSSGVGYDSMPKAPVVQGRLLKGQ
jgi:hypothetical protein